MSKALEAGQWCKPRNEQEWKAILDLAGVLGVYAEPHDALYDNYPCVWSNGSGRVSQCRNEPCHKTCLVSVPDFLAGMYATAKETNIAPAEAEADLLRRLKFMEDTIASLDVPKPDGLEDRIKALEDVGPIEFRNPQKLILELRPVFASQGDMLRVIQRIEALEKGMTKTTSVLDDAFEVDKMLKQRLEKLEGHRIACIGDHQEAFHAERRLSKLEAAFNEHLVKEREVSEDYAHNISLWSTGRSPIIEVSPNPKASPKDIPFEVALAYLKAGRKVGRRGVGWMMASTTGALVDFVFMRGFGVIKHKEANGGYEEEWTPTVTDIMMADWEVLPE